MESFLERQEAIESHLGKKAAESNYFGKTTEKNIALTIWTFISKVMSLLFNTLFRFVIAFLPRSRCLLISWLSPSTVVTAMEPKKIKPVTVSTFSPSIYQEGLELDATSLFF